MAVVVGIFGVSCLCCCCEVVVEKVFGIRVGVGGDVCFKLGVLSGEGLGVFVCRRGTEIEGEICAYFVESESLGGGVIDEGAG